VGSSLPAQSNRKISEFQQVQTPPGIEVSLARISIRRLMSLIFFRIPGILTIWNRSFPGGENFSPPRFF